MLEPKIQVSFRGKGRVTVYAKGPSGRQYVRSWDCISVSPMSAEEMNRETEQCATAELMKDWERYELKKDNAA